MKIIVYAISKNEEKFVDRWYESVKDADSIYVLDTGSTDKTVERLRDRGVNVQVMEINPWRFDVARNESLKMVPNDVDVCVCIDLDEVLLPGWREEIEKVWKDGVNHLRYKYNWRLDDKDRPLVSFYYEKIHARDGFSWVHPVHEVLAYSGDNEVFAVSDNVVVNHYPDASKSRGSYLPLLEMSVQEEPEDDRNMHYLGREYMYYGKWNECIETLIRHLNLKSATWRDERCASCRFIGRSYMNMGRYDEARMWFLKGINEASYLREPYIELALLEYRLGNYFEVTVNCLKGLMMGENKMSYINEVFCYDNTIDDLLSVSYYNLGLYDLALYHVDKAISYDSDKDMDRLVKNRELILEKMKK